MNCMIYKKLYSDKLNRIELKDIVSIIEEINVISKGWNITLENIKLIMCELHKNKVQYYAFNYKFSNVYIRRISRINIYDFLSLFIKDEKQINYLIFKILTNKF